MVTNNSMVDLCSCQDSNASSNVIINLYISECTYMEYSYIPYNDFHFN